MTQTAFWGETFTFNGVSCSDYDLMLYDIGNSGREESEFAGVVSIDDQLIAGRWKPLFFGTKHQNKLVFNLIFGVNSCRIDDGNYLTRYELDSVASWLTGYDHYLPLVINQEDLIGIHYKCMITDLSVISYGRIPWALRATVSCDGPYAYMNKTTISYDTSSRIVVFVSNAVLVFDPIVPVSVNTIGTEGNVLIENSWKAKVENEILDIQNRAPSEININNPSCLNDYYYPIIEMTINNSAGASNVSIVNTSDANRTFTIQNIPGSISKITINCDTCVMSDDQGIGLYGKCNFQWPRMTPGDNNIIVSGIDELKIISEFPIDVGG